MGLLEAKVRDFIKRHSIVEENSSILIGVSGGPDSLALLHFLAGIRKEYHLTLRVATIDHMFRGTESFEELKYVEEICEKWDIPFNGQQINVPEEINKQRGNPQTISRKLRYQFYSEVMEKYQIPFLALAHHGDDQMETILMRMTRGSAIGSMAGIHIKRPFGNGQIIRPFLCITKDEIEEYIKKNDLHPVYDPSNKKDIYARNRFRKYVLPFLKKENPHVHKHFQQFSEAISQDDQYLMCLAQEKFEHLVSFQQKDTLTFNIDDFLQIPLPLQRRCIHLILNYLYRDKLVGDLSNIHIQSIIELCLQDTPSSKLNLPDGLTVFRSYNICTFTFNQRSSKTFKMYWNKGETLNLPNGHQLIMKLDEEVLAQGEQYFLLDKNTSFPLTVRSRLTGDRMIQKGSGGTKKLKSLFIDCKIPLQLRDEWPIITDQNGNILWVPLLKKSQYEANPLKEDVIVLQYKLNEHTQEDQI